MTDALGRDEPYMEGPFKEDGMSSAIQEICAGCGLLLGSSQVTVNIWGRNYHASCAGGTHAITAERDAAIAEVERQATVVMPRMQADTDFFREQADQLRRKARKWKRKMGEWRHPARVEAEARDEARNDALAEAATVAFERAQIAWRGGDDVSHSAATDIHRGIAALKRPTSGSERAQEADTAPSAPQDSAEMEIWPGDMFTATYETDGETIRNLKIRRDNPSAELSPLPTPDVEVVRAWDSAPEDRCFDRKPLAGHDAGAPTLDPKRQATARPSSDFRPLPNLSRREF